MNPEVIAASIMGWVKMNPVGTLYVLTALITSGIITWNRKKLSTTVTNYTEQSTTNYRDMKTLTVNLENSLKATDYEVRRFHNLVSTVHQEVCNFKIDSNANANRISNEVKSLGHEIETVKEGTKRILQVGAKLMEVNKKVDDLNGRVLHVDENHNTLFKVLSDLKNRKKES